MDFHNKRGAVAPRHAQLFQKKEYQLMKLLLTSLLFFMLACAQKQVEETPVIDPAIAAKAEENRVRTYLNSKITKTFAETQSLEVIYATNRDLSGDKVGCSNKLFGVQVGKGVRYGTCKVNIPKKHPTGLIESSTDPRSDSHRFFRFLGGRHNQTPEALKQSLEEKKPPSILLFVHGFNVKFEEAIMRAAQIAYDLKYQGQIVLFSWPAGSQDGIMNSLLNKTYEANTVTATASVNDAAAFIQWLSTLNIPIHLAVHSMGHQVIIPALDKIAQTLQQPIIDELVLNAPDLPVEDFRKFLPSVTKLAKRVTVYCSFNDNAIAASETYNNNRRLGACETAEGVDMINVSEIDAPAMGVTGLGHGYYSSRAILTDVQQLLLGIEAERRLFIRKSEPNSVEDFYLRQ
jgi:esterase/lipase superfamily enzyme